MGVTENVAREFGISRAAQDAFALASQKAATAQREGRFAAEIAPGRVASRTGDTLVEADEQIRVDANLEGLTKLPAAFDSNGTVTAGIRACRRQSLRRLSGSWVPSSIDRSTCRSGRSAQPSILFSYAFGSRAIIP